MTNEATATIDVDAPVDTDGPVEDAPLNAAGELMTVAVGLVEVPKLLLRGVQRKTEGFQYLRDAIKKEGLLHPLVVRREQVGGLEKFILVDGLQRLTIIKDLGYTEVTVNVVDRDQNEAHVTSLITNLCRIDTRPADQGRQLLRVLNAKPEYTLSDLARECCQSEDWVTKRMSLANLIGEAAAAVNTNRMKLQNAFVLAKFDDPEMQQQHLAAAISEPPISFVPEMRKLQAAQKAAKKQGKDAKDAKVEWKPVAICQKKAVLVGEYNALHKSEGESQLAALVKKHGVKTVDDAVKLFTAWVLTLDEDGQAKQASAHKAKAEANKKRNDLAKAERERQKAAEEQRRLADLTANV